MAAFLASDSWFSKQVPASEIARSRSVSNDGAFALAGAAGGMFLIGKIKAQRSRLRNRILPLSKLP